MKFSINGKIVEVKEVPSGGTTGQALLKASDADGDVKWGSVGGVPSGCILIWSGAANGIPSGWALCDGTNGTPDLRDRFVLGAGNKYAVGATGGSEEVTLTTQQMPRHIHIVKAPAVKTDGGSATFGFATSNTVSSLGVQSISSENNGGSQPHENMPPYYTLAYIMKL